MFEHGMSPIGLCVRTMGLNQCSSQRCYFGMLGTFRKQGLAGVSGSLGDECPGQS